MAHRFRIRTVHGTFAGDKEERDQGDRWWQRGSAFSDALLSYLGTPDRPVTWEPFHWSGSNSARDRHKAEIALAEKVRADAGRGDEFLVHLCHSHGGNVFHSASLRTLRRYRLVPAGICVGTPFMPVTGLAELSNEGMFLPLRRRATLLFIALALILAIWVLPMPDLVAWLAVWIATALLAAYYILLLTTMNGFIVPLMMPVAGWLQERFRGGGGPAGSGTEQLFDRDARRANPFHPKIFSRLDEAINGLRELPGQRIALATPGTTFAPAALALSIFLLIVLLALDAAVQLIGPGYLVERAAGTWFWRGSADHPVFAQAAEILVVLILAFFGGMAVAAAGGAWLGAWLFNRTLTGILKRRGFGDDTVLKSAVQYHADSNLPLLFGTYAPNEAWRPLPDDFDAVMKPMLDAQTSASLVKLREALAISMTTDGASILDSVKQSFTGSELVHTNYFAHPDFAPFLAFLLVEHHGFPPSGRYAEIDTAKYADWFTAIRAADHVSRVEWAKKQGWADPFSGPARVTPSS